MVRFAMLLRMRNPRDEQLEWLQAVKAATGLSSTALANKAKVAQSTITNFEKPDWPHPLSTRTVTKIENATGMRMGPQPRPRGMRDSEAEPFDPNGAVDPISVLLRQAVTSSNALACWTLQSRALESAGYLPGDVLIVDMNAKLAPGDVVCAQLYDWARSRAETVFRIWEPPALVSATMDPDLRKPFVVDSENVVIKGVVVGTLRPRPVRPRAAA